MIPNDPVMLYSFLNLKLRDYYDSLEKLCEDLDVRKEEILQKMQEAGYIYDRAANRFCLA